MSHISPRDKGRLQENGLNQFTSLPPFLVFLSVTPFLSFYVSDASRQSCSYMTNDRLFHHAARRRALAHGNKLYCFIMKPIVESYMTFHVALSYNFCGNASPQMHYSTSTSSNIPVQLHTAPLCMKYMWAEDTHGSFKHIVHVL